MTPDVFDRMRTPRPPADLRERAMRAARAAAREAPATDTAPWGFRRLDLVWVAALLLLVACNVWLSLANRAAATVSARRSALASPVEPVAQLVGESDLLAVGMRLDAEPAGPEPWLTLGQALRIGS